MATKIITAKQQLRAAQSFNFFSCVAILLPVLIPIWIAASIFVYAAVAIIPIKKFAVFLCQQGIVFMVWQAVW